MVELTPGSGMYHYQYDIDSVQRVRDPSAQGTAAYGKRIAKTPHEHILHKERLS